MYKRFCDWCKNEVTKSYATIQLLWWTEHGQDWRAMLCKYCVKKVEDLANKSNLAIKCKIEK